MPRAQRDPVAVSDEWARYREKALRAVKRGYQPPAFASDVLPPGLHAAVARRLQSATTPDDVRAIFAEARELERAAQEANKPEFTGVMVGHFLPTETAERLALPNQGADGVQKPDNLHVTMLYLGDSSQYSPQDLDRLRRAVASAVADEPPLPPGRISGVGRFRGKPSADGTPSRDPIYGSVDVKGLHKLRERLADALRRAGFPPSDDYEYTPHVTLAYVPSEADTPVERVPEVPVHIDRVHLAVAGQRQEFPLGSEQGYASTPARASDASAAVRELATTLTTEIRAALRADVLDALRY